MTVGGVTGPSDELKRRRFVSSPKNVLDITFFWRLLIDCKGKGMTTMKISKGLSDLTTTQTEMARLLGLTQPRVHQLIEEGVVVKAANGSVLVIDSLKNFYKSRAIEEGTGIEELDFNLEKARHERTKREISELKLAKLQGSVYDARTVEYVMTELYATLRTQLLGIPAKLAPQLAEKPKEAIYTTLTREIEDRLGEVASYDPKLFRDADVVEEEVGNEDS